MVESGYVFSQTDYDQKLGIDANLCGQLTPEAQMARFHALVGEGVPDDVARQTLGLADEDFQSAAEYVPTVLPEVEVILIPEGLPVTMSAWDEANERGMSIEQYFEG